MMNRWQEVRRTYTPPVSGVERVRGVTPQVMQEMLQGFTVVELRCIRTGDVKFVRTPGRSE